MIQTLFNRRYRPLFVSSLPMRKLFFKNLILLQGLNLVIKPVWLLIIDRMAQNLLGEAVYGEYYIILNLTLVSNILLDMGIQNFNNASVASDPFFFKSNFRNILLAKLVLSSAYFILVWSIGQGLKLQGNLLLLLLLNQVMTSFILYLRSNINGLHHYTIDSLLSVSDKFFGILFCLAFFFTSHIHIYYFALAQLLASAISLLVAATLNIRYYQGLELVPHLLRESVYALLKKSLPYALLFALMGLYTKGDVLMMKWLLPDAVLHCGRYAQSVRLLDAGNMFAMLFSGLLLPMFARQIYANEDVRPLANIASTMLALVSLTVALASVLMSEDILKLLNYRYSSHGELLASAAVFRNIMLCFIPMSMIYVYSTLLTARRDIVYMNVFAVIALLVNVVLNLFLIPEYKSYGASLSSLATQSIFSLLCFIRCYSHFGFRLEFSRLLRFFVFVICLTGVYFVLKGLGNTWVILLIFSFSSLVLSVLLKIIDVRKIFPTFKAIRQ
jgi:O-antigen/teichoic acid export membrane protein